MSLEDLVNVTNNQQWALDKTTGEVKVTEKRGFIGRVVDWLRGFNKHSEVFHQVAQEISRDVQQDYAHTKAKVALRDRVEEQTTDYYNKTTVVGRFLRGNGDVASSAEEVSTSVYNDLYTLFSEGLKQVIPEEDKRAFVDKMYGGLTNINATPIEIDEFNEAMEDYYDNAHDRLDAFADLNYPIARYLQAESKIGTMEALAQEGILVAKYRLYRLYHLHSSQQPDMVDNQGKTIAEKFHLLTLDLGRKDDELFVQAGINTLVGFGTAGDPHAAMLIAKEVLLTPNLPEPLKVRAERLETVARVLSAPSKDVSREDVASCRLALGELLWPDQREAFLQKLAGKDNAVAHYLIHQDSGNLEPLRLAAVAELPSAQADLAFVLNNRGQPEAAFEWALKASHADESAKYLIAAISINKRNFALARQYALELVNSSYPKIQAGAFLFLGQFVVEFFRNQNPRLVEQLQSMLQIHPRVSYAFMLEHGLGVEKDINLAIEQYGLLGPNMLSYVANIAIQNGRYDDAFAFYTAAAEKGEVGSRIAAIRMIRHGLVEGSIKDALEMCVEDPNMKNSDRLDILFEKAELMLAENNGRFSNTIVKEYEVLAKDGDPRGQARLIEYSRQPNVTYSLMRFHKNRLPTDLIGQWDKGLSYALQRVEMPINQGALSATLRFELEEIKRGDHTKLALALNTIIRDESSTSDTVAALEDNESMLLTQYADFVKSMSPDFHREALERVAKLVFSTNRVSDQQIGALEYALAILEDAPKQKIFLKELTRIANLMDRDETASAVNNLRDFSLGKNLMPENLTEQQTQQINRIVGVLATTYERDGRRILDATSLYGFANIVQNTVNPRSLDGVKKLLGNDFEGEVRDSRVDRFIDDLQDEGVTLDDIAKNYIGKSYVPLEVSVALIQGETLTDEAYDQWVRPLAARYQALDPKDRYEHLGNIAVLLVNIRDPSLAHLRKIEALLAA
ncbi:MAG: hypothetical protein Q8K75_10090 [Chlamydiales bacterium]|nr:hypothetical protein [Chlamydiales bacterium]